jgi:hypothetical protein
MRIAAHFLAYNVSRFIKPVLENLEPHVDKIYVAYSERPFGYLEKSQQTLKNQTSVADICAASESDKIEIIKGNWRTEEEMRNECLVTARTDGFDWLLIHNAGEFYPEASWQRIKQILLQNKSDNHLATTCYSFWKTSHYVLTDLKGAIKSVNNGFAVRCSSDIKLIEGHHSNNQFDKVIDCPCYDYSYVMSDAEMAEKVAALRYTNQFFLNSWYAYKWLNWNESSRWLSPVNPYEFYRAIPFPMSQPAFAEEFALPVNPYKHQQIPSFFDMIGEVFYDASVRISMVRDGVRGIAMTMRLVE